VEIFEAQGGWCTTGVVDTGVKFKNSSIRNVVKFYGWIQKDQ
jgi:hypothetical protein